MSNQLVITAGAKVRNLDGVLTATSGVVSSVPLGAANGVATLDSGGKVPVSQLPSSVVTYLGTWNAATNTPTLVNGTGDAGDMYLCNVAGTVNFGAGPITFAVGDWVLYGSGTWQKSNGQNGTVTSVAASITGSAIGITGSPITTAGTLAFAFSGTSGQYVNGAGNLTTFPTLITSIGLSMPSAFSVANSPLTANGTIAVTGAGYASQYIRGDGTLADFPSSGGGGSSVSYYLNGGTSQGTIGGTTYYEMSKTADTGTGVDFTKSGDGFIVAFLTDANDPAQLNIPAGNWNYEIYASMSANGGTPQMYAELYKYDGTTFTLISTSSNEILYDGVNLNLYTFGMTVPATTLTLTDRLAVKLYATNSGGKTTTVHTQDSHLCQVITTFSTGITALNGLTAQVQYFATGTTGTDFNISSTTATHTFNIPDASATARGLITTGTQTIAGTKTFSGIIKGDGSILLKNGIQSVLSGYVNIGGNAFGRGIDITFPDSGGSPLINTLNFNPTTAYSYTFPAATGTIALTSNLANYVDLTTAQTIGGTKTFSDATKNNGGIFLQNASSNSLAGYMNIGGLTNGVKFTSGGGISNTFTLPSATGYTFTFPNGTGTLALTSDIPSITGLVPYTGATGAVDLGIYNLTSNSLKVDGNTTQGGSLSFKQYVSSSTGGSAGYTGISALGTTQLTISFNTGTTNYKNVVFDVSSITNNTVKYYTLPNATGTLALTSDLTGGTVTSVAALTIGTSGTDLSSTVANSTTTPVITLNVPTASATNRGALSSADWTTFNNKQNALTNPVLASGTWTSGYLPKINGTYTIGNSLVYDNGTNILIGKTTSTGGLVQISNGTNMYNFDYDASGPYFTTVNNANTVYKRFTLDASELYFNIAASPKMILNASGNLGLGVTPSAWYSTFQAFQFGANGSSIFGRSENNMAAFASNAYVNSAGSFTYINTNTASYYQQLNGQHQWYNAPSGTAGAAITFTQAMTLTASGRLLIGTPTEASYLLDVNGTGRFSGRLLVNHSTASDYAAVIYNTSATGEGLVVRGGSTSSHNAFVVQPYNGAVSLFSVLATGAATFSSTIAAATESTFTGTSANTRVLITASGVANTVIGFNNSGATTTGVINNAAYVGVLQAYPLIFTIDSVERLRIASTGAATFSSSAENVVTWSRTSSKNWSLSSDSAGGYFKNTTDSVIPIYMTNAGNVGIGTTAPAKTLTVVNTAEQLRLSYGGSNFTDFRNDSAGGLLINTNAGYIINYIGGTERLRIKTNTINISSLPTSSAGLSSGDLYSSAGVLMIV